MTLSSTQLAYAGRNTPRYTSYPTAPHFHDGVNADVYAAWLGTQDTEQSASLYLHIPYCREMCWYCGCSTRATQRDEPVAAYVKTLLREIDLAAGLLPGKPRVNHIHFGGGTPTILTQDQFTAVMTRLREHFSVPESAEIAIEIDPRIFTRAMAEHLAANGINRASIGVQTLDPGVQAKINRIQPLPVVADTVNHLRAAGIANISFDLLYGLPGQTRSSCLETLEAALTLKPDRLSVFGYAHVPHMKRHQKLIRTDDLPGPEARVEQAMAIAAAAEAAGYRPVGIDHYVRDGDEMDRLARDGKVRRNFQGYTTDQAGFLIGLGASAISKLDAGYAQNTPDVRAWSAAIGAGGPATARGIALTAEDRLRGEIIERLMCELEVDVEAVAARFEARLDLPAMADLEADGIIRRDGSHIALAEDCRLLARIVAARFDDRLPQGTAVRHSVSV
ncbi:oxygen-independent coproporphyrinogen III oxidase [Hyphobacterium indicum]|uniref:oxygen-independent coproporphyrinogen III oxidase n=1 Tax=Hyphobacterium indicum TaxID=2162714 RepID=UPI000D644316|nr:oxygen-independent coproporphyrinogen III oxidase [Hyphobacterium indicum]